MSRHRRGRDGGTEHLDEHGLLVREALTSGLYLALVLLGAIVATPDDSLPSDAVAVRLLLGTALGLVLAHLLAFRLAARLTHSSGDLTMIAAREAGAQIVGSLVVAGAATIPFLLLDGRSARIGALLVLAALPAISGLVIGRLNGLGWSRALLWASLVLVLAVTVVVVKASVSH